MAPEPPWRQKDTRQARPTAKTASAATGATGQRPTTHRSLAKRSAVELTQREACKVVTQEESVTAKEKTKGGKGKSNVQSARGGVLMGARAKGAKCKGKTRAAQGGKERGGTGLAEVLSGKAGNGEEANISAKEEPKKPQAGKGQRLRLPRPKVPKPKASETLQVKLPEVQPTPKRRLAPKVPKELPEEPETTGFEELGDLGDRWNTGTFHEEQETTAAMDHVLDMEDAKNMEHSFEDPIEDYPEEPLILPKRTSLIAELLTDFGCFKQRKC